MFQVFSKYVSDVSVFLGVWNQTVSWLIGHKIHLFSSSFFPDITKLWMGALMLVFPSSSTWIEDEKKSINRKEPSITTTLLLLLLLLGIACCVVLCVVLLQQSQDVLYQTENPSRAASLLVFLRLHHMCFQNAVLSSWQLTQIFLTLAHEKKNGPCI